MATAGERFKNWLEALSADWGERLKGWFASWVRWGIEQFLDVIAQKSSATLRPMIEKLESETTIPPEIKPLLDEIKEPTGEWGALLGQSAAGAIIGGALNRIIDYLLRPVTFGLGKAPLFDIPEPAFLNIARLREFITEDKFDSLCSWLGLSDEHKELIKKIYVYFPTPQDLILWEAKEVFEPDMIAKFGLADEFDRLDLSLFAKAGVSEEMAKNFWIAHWNYPSLGTVFDMLHRGEIEWDDVYEYMRLAEYPPFWREKLERVSWDLPNRIELRMMARYGLVDKAFLLDMLKKVGLHEDYRDVAADMMLVMGLYSDLAARYGKGWLTADDIKAELAATGLSEGIQERTYQRIVKQASTERVTKERDLTVTDIIKGVKKGVITRTEGQELIQEMGYDAEEAKFKLDINAPEEETVAETKQRELTKSDILNAYKLGQIDDAEAVLRLMSIRYSEDDAIFLLILTLATMDKIAEVKDRDLTKADIIKGVKNGVITQEEGYIMLLTIGYSSDESNFILSVNPITIAGSPSTFNEFQAMAQSYRASQGLPTKKITLDIIQAERDVKAAQAALKIGKEKKVKKARIAELELAVEQTKQRYHELIKPPEAKA